MNMCSSFFVYVHIFGHSWWYTTIVLHIKARLATILGSEPDCLCALTGHLT